MKIRNKILLGFSVIILLALIANLLALYQIHQIKGDVTVMYRHPLVVSNAVRDINTSVNAMHRDMKDVAMADDSSQLELKIEEVRQKHQEVLELIGILRDRYLGNLNDVEQFNRLFMDWEPIRNEVISFKYQNMNQAAADITRGRGAAHVELMLAQLRNISDFARKKADELYVDTLQSEAKSWDITVLVIISTLAIAIILTVFLSQNITRPIRKFVNEMQLAFNSIHIDTNAHTEEELLKVTASEIKRARQRIAENENELNALNAKLEEKVRERTVDLEHKSQQLDEKNRKLQIEIEERAQIEEELQSTNEELQVEINQRSAVEEELRASNDQLVSEMENRRQSENTALSERNFSNAILNSLPGLFYMYDANGKLVRWNNNFPQTTGYDTDELGQKTALDFFPAEFREPVGKRIEGVFTKGSDSVEAELLTKSGKRIPYYFTGTRINYEDNLYLVGHGSDLSEVKNARKEVENFFNVALDLLCIAGTDGYFKKANPSWEKILGYTFEELTEQPFFEFIHPEDLAITQDSLNKLSKGSRVVNFINRFRTKEGNYRWLKWNTAPQGDTLYAAATDISDLKETEEELKKLLIDLEISNQELERFAYVASHDLQEPLRMVTSFLQLIEKKYNDKLDDEGREFIDFAVDGANRMKKLINDLLKYSRVGTRGKPFEPVNLNDILKRTLTILTPDIEINKAKFTFDELPTIDADESQMLQLFQNLIANAIKFRSEKPPEIIIRAEEKKNEWIFRFRDNGIGIEKQFFDRIFIIFQRLHGKDKYRGTGIGLAICKKIVERHNGYISLTSEIDKGTEFIFSIPKNLSKLTGKQYI